MEFKNAKYVKVSNGEGMGDTVTISATIGDKIWSIPTIVGNRYYDEIIKQVNAGTLTIEDAV